MKVKMIADVSGSCDGVPWPNKGEIVDLPDTQARSALDSGLAVEAKKGDKTSPAPAALAVGYEGGKTPNKPPKPYDRWADEEEETTAAVQSPTDSPEAPEDGVRVGATGGGEEVAIAPEAETPEDGLTTRNAPVKGKNA